MSHFTKCETKITDIGALLKALDDLKWKYTYANGDNVEVGGYNGKKTKGVVSIKTKLNGYDVGVIKKKDGTYELVADWSMLQGHIHLDQDKFVQELNQKYAYVRVTEACKQAGYDIDSVLKGKNGEIEVNVVKWS